MRPSNHRPSRRNSVLPVPTSKASTAAAAIFTAALTLGSGCETKTAPEAKPCCEQPKIPAGVPSFTIVGDEVNGPSDGQTVKLRAALGGPIKRDDVYPVLHTLYRHAMTRGPFEPINFTAEVFASDVEARSNGKPVATVSRGQSQLAPVCDNAVAYDFEETVSRAFDATLGRAPEENSEDTCRMAPPKRAARVDDSFKHQPALKIDGARRAVAITYPYLETGKDEYVPTLGFNTAMTYWIDVTTSMFRKVPDLKEVAFQGVHADAPVVDITVTRNDFESKLASLQEDVAAHAAVTFASLGMKTKDDKGAHKEQETFKAKTYKGALAALPKNQVTISPKLK